MKAPIVPLTVLIAWFPLHAPAADQAVPVAPASADRSSVKPPVSSPISAAISAGLPKHFKDFADTLLRVGDAAGNKELNAEIRRTFMRHPDTLIDAMDKSANNGRR